MCNQPPSNIEARGKSPILLLQINNEQHCSISCMIICIGCTGKWATGIPLSVKGKKQPVISVVTARVVLFLIGNEKQRRFQNTKEGP